MVRSIKLTGLAFTAVLALGAVTATTASATPLIHFTKEGEFSGKGGAVILEGKSEGHAEISCTGTNTKGTVVTEDRVHILIEFLTCTGALSSVCTTTEGGGEVGTKGNIHVLALALLGSDEAPPNDNPALLVAPENSKNEKANLTFRCSGFGSELTVKNSIIGLALNVASATKCGILIHFNKAGKGTQQDRKFWESETNVEDFLEIESKGILSFPFEEWSWEAQTTLEGPNNILIAT